MSSHRAVAAAFAAALAFAALAHAQEAPEQMVWLKGGGFVRGQLLELIPGDHVTLKLSSGETKRFSYADIERTAPVASPASPAGSSAQPSKPPAPSTPPSAQPAASSVAAAPAPAPESKPKRSDAAVVKIFARGAAVELQSKPRFEDGAWTPACTAPCDAPVKMVDRDFRVAGEGITPSNPFRMEPGDDAVKIEVSPGKQWSRDWGRRGLVVGVPLLLLGGVGIGIDAGTNVKGREVIGAVGLGAVIAGGLMTVVAIPLLLSSSTRVKNQKGEVISLSQGAWVF